MRSRDITLWLDERWYDALSKHLKGETLEEHLQNKVDGVLLRTVLHGRNPERFSRSNQDLLYRAACMLHGKTIL